MPMSATEKIRAAMRRLGITNTRLAELTGWSRQNISNKFSRDNLTEEDIAKIADAIGCKVEILITLPDGDQWFRGSRSGQARCSTRSPWPHAALQVLRNGFASISFRPGVWTVEFESLLQQLLHCDHTPCRNLSHGHRKDIPVCRAFFTGRCKIWRSSLRWKETEKERDAHSIQWTSLSLQWV